jgi:DNA-directed RNA polymerase specialized sigma24 family protein
MLIQKNPELRAEFEGRYSRCRNSLYFLARGALGNVGEAEEAMKHCYRKACRQPKRFTSDGEFGSWIIRLLINEIVLVANRRMFEANEMMSEAEYPEARYISVRE